MSITYQDLLKLAENRLASRADAEYFVLALTNKKRHELYGSVNTATQQEINAFDRCVGKHKPAMPVQYLVNKAYFLSFELYVDERVMIPRPETEELVVITASRIKKSGITPGAILDIGTGSGAIAVAMANIFPEAKVVATDISGQALEVAKFNITKYGLAHKIALIQTDLFPINKDKFDIIISNPPYIPRDEIEILGPSIKNFEPTIALNGEQDGFEIIEKIIQRASDYLAQNRLLALEIDPRQEKLIQALAFNAEFEKDNQELTRYCFVTKL